jgi:hypothetical protein
MLLSAGAIARYPAQPASLTTLFALSLGMLLTIAPLVGFLFQLVIWAAAYHYAVEVFERSANGSTAAPEFAPEQDGSGWTLLILQLFFSACHAWLDARVETAGLRWLGFGLIAFVQPAMTIATAMNRDIASAFDPARVLRVAAGIGAAYALLVVAGIGLGAVQQFMGSIVSGGRAYVLVVVSGIGMGGALQVQGALSGNWLLVLLGQVLAGFAWFYAIVMYFHALGRVVFARSDALGFTPVPETTLRPEDRHAPLMRRVEDLVASGDHAAAARMLRDCLASEPHTSPAMHARYRELLAHMGDQFGLIEHARARIDALLVAGCGREALAMLRESLAVDPSFRPASAESTTQLACVAENQGQAELAIALLRDYSQRHPRDPAIPDNAKRVARLLIERHADIAGARAALQSAIDRMLPAHPQYAEMLEERNHLDLLSQRLPTKPAA